MGIEVAIGLISLVVGVVGGIAQQNAANDAANAQREANNVSAAQQQVTSLEDQRQRIREDRVRRAQIINAAESQGTSASSGEAGAISSLDTNFANLVAGSRSVSNSNDFINQYNQQAEDASERGNTYKAMTNLVQDSLSTFGTIFDPKPKTIH